MIDEDCRFIRIGCHFANRSVAMCISEIACLRLIPMLRNSGLWSTPTNVRPVRFAAIPVVQLPAKGSSIAALGRVDAMIIRYNNCKGFCVGCLPYIFSHCSAADIVHTSCIGSPLFIRVINSLLK